MGSPPAAPIPSRRSPRIGQAGRRHPVRMSLPSATGCPMASAVAKTTRSRRRQDLAAAGREAFPDYPASMQGEGVGGWAYINQDCRDVWKVPAAPEAMRQPVASSIPTLLISGSFDTLTSLAGAEAAAAQPVKSDDHQHPRHRAFRGPSIAVRADGHRIIPRRSERARHILRRHSEATCFRSFLIRRGKTLFAEKRGLATSQACRIWRWRRCPANHSTSHDCNACDPPAGRSRTGPSCSPARRM